MKFSSIVRESTIVLLLSLSIGFVYTYSTGKGYFGSTPPSKKRPSVAAAELIDIHKARQLHESGQALFIDARHEFDYRLGHIAGAYSLPLADFDQHIDTLNRFSRDRTIVTYCDGAQCNSSIELAAMLQSRGFSNVYIFFGGWDEWKSKDLPTQVSPG